VVEYLTKVDVELAAICHLITIEVFDGVRVTKVISSGTAKTGTAGKTARSTPKINPVIIFFIFIASTGIR
jgi:hypothetical protein